MFVHYINQINVFPIFLLPFLGCLRKSRKGDPVVNLLKQMFCFCLDGTSRHLTYFDTLQKDAGYAAAIETAPCDMASSHAVKRFCQAFFRPLVRGRKKHWDFMIVLQDDSLPSVWEVGACASCTARTSSSEGGVSGGCTSGEST